MKAKPTDKNIEDIFIDTAKECFLELFKKDPSCPRYNSNIAINAACTFIEELKQKIK